MATTPDNPENVARSLVAWLDRNLTAPVSTLGYVEEINLPSWSVSFYESTSFGGLVVANTATNQDVIGMGVVGTCALDYFWHSNDEAKSPYDAYLEARSELFELVRFTAGIPVEKLDGVVYNYDVATSIEIRDLDETQFDARQDSTGTALRISFSFRYKYEHRSVRS